MPRVGATGAPAISGQVVKVSGETLQLASGTGPISVSGQPIKISGETVQLASGTGPISVSGQPIKISGETVIAKVSGETLKLASGTGPISVSGQPIRISGETVIAKVSGETVIAKVSGEVVDIKVPTEVKTAELRVVTGDSGGAVLHSGAVVSVTIKALAANSGDIYVGGATNRPYSGFGFCLEKGEAINLDASDFNNVYLCATVSGDRVTFLGIA